MFPQVVLASSARRSSRAAPQLRLYSPSAADPCGRLPARLLQHFGTDSSSDPSPAIPASRFTANVQPKRKQPALANAAAPTMVLRSRSALGDIGNCAVKPKVRPAAKKSALEENHGKPSATNAPAVEKVTRRALRIAAKEDVPPPAPEPQPESSQSEFQPSISLEKISEWDPAEDILCEAFSSVLLESEDLDMKENDDPNMCSSYVKDIYKYLRHLEENRPVTCKYLAGEEINGNMQATLINWLVQVQMKFSLHQETLYLTVAIIYHFLQDNTVFKMKLPLVGVTAMFIASKYEEVFPPCIRDFSYVTNYTCLKFHIRKMESKILKAMDFCLGFSLPLHFLKRASRTPQMSFEQYVLAKYLMELCIVNYDMVHFCPSRTAAAAFCLSLKLLSGWKLLQYLQQLTSYTESDILPVMQHMAKNVVNVNKGATKQQAILKKYATEAHTKISTIEQLDSSIIWELAKPLVKNL